MGVGVGPKICTSAISETVRIPVELFSVPVTSTCLSLNLLRSIDFGTSKTTKVPFRRASK